MKIVGKIAKIVSFGLFLSTLVFINYIRDIALVATQAISRSFNIAVAIDGKTPIEVVSDRIEALDGVGSVKVIKSAEIFEGYKKDSHFHTRVPLSENVFNDYILVYPDDIHSKSAIESLSLKIKKTSGVDETSWDASSVEIYLFLKNKILRYVNFVLVFIIFISVMLWLAAFYIYKKSSSAAGFRIFPYLTYSYYLLAVGALILVGASALYRHAGMVFNWLVSGCGMIVAAAAASVIFQNSEEG